MTFKVNNQNCCCEAGITMTIQKKVTKRFPEFYIWKGADNDNADWKSGM